MTPNKSRRDFLRKGAAATAGLVAAGAAQSTEAADQPEKHEHDPKPQHQYKDYPRDRPGLGGPVGSSTDRGKLMPGLRTPGLPPMPVVTPDLVKLPHTMKDGVKEFHLVAKHTRREFLPGAWMDVWGYNDSMPGPTIEANEGDRVRIVLHNELPESTVLHLHGLELPNRFDGVHGVTQDPIKPGKSFAYELTEVDPFV